jgi:hypothetical protein
MIPELVFTDKKYFLKSITSSYSTGNIQILETIYFSSVVAPNSFFSDSDPQIFLSDSVSDSDL